jgi:hypothetical protein
MSFSKLSKFIDVSLNNQNTVYNFIFFNLNYEKKKKKKKPSHPWPKKGGEQPLVRSGIKRKLNMEYGAFTPNSTTHTET